MNAVAVLFSAVRLARRPEQLPDLPWGLALLVIVSAATYFAGKYAEGGRPVVLSVVRAREAGDLDAPIRTGDDIEIRGAGFVPPGAGYPGPAGPDGRPHRRGPCPCPPGPGPRRLRQPDGRGADVPVPVDVEPGPVEVQVVTAAGVETNRVIVDVMD